MSIDDHSGHMGDMHASHQSFDCSGNVWMDMGSDKSGTWSGHVLAGVALLIWNLHWNFNVFRNFLLQSRQKPYRSSSTYPIPLIPDYIPVEAALKIIVPLCGILMNLFGPEGRRSNICADGTVRAGHFDPTNIFRYADAWLLFTFMASGMVDLLGWAVELPSGTQHFFLVAAFALKSFILSEGQYADMLESMVYFMLFMVTAGTALFLLAEMIWPESFLASCGRVYCTYLQAIWYFGAARLLFEGRTAWNTTEPMPDMSPAMFVPVPFVFWMNFTSLTMFLGYLGMRWAFKSHLGDGLRAACSTSGDTERPHHLLPHHDTEEPHQAYGNGRVLTGGSAKAAGLHELIPLVSRH